MFFGLTYAALNMKVEGLMRLMEGEHVGPFNLGNPGEFTMLELAQVCSFTMEKIAFKISNLLNGFAFKSTKTLRCSITGGPGDNRPECKN